MSQFRSHYYTASPLVRHSGKLRKVLLFVLGVVALAMVIKA